MDGQIEHVDFEIFYLANMRRQGVNPNRHVMNPKHLSLSDGFVDTMDET
jgi:hypothetical protein